MTIDRSIFDGSGLGEAAKDELLANFQRDGLTHEQAADILNQGKAKAESVISALRGMPGQIDLANIVDVVGALMPGYEEAVKQLDKLIEDMNALQPMLGTLTLVKVFKSRQDAHLKKMSEKRRANLMNIPADETTDEQKRQIFDLLLSESNNPQEFEAKVASHFGEGTIKVKSLMIVRDEDGNVTEHAVGGDGTDAFSHMEPNDFEDGEGDTPDVKLIEPQPIAPLGNDEKIADHARAFLAERRAAMEKREREAAERKTKPE